MTEQTNAEKMIFENYLETTSGQFRSIDETHYENCAPGLKRRLGDWLPRPDSDVLDLGCGLGELLYACEDRAQSLTGVNICSPEIETARNFVDAQFHCADVLDFLRGTNSQFDWIGCMNLLEHLGKDEILEVLALSSERLRPGGVFVAMVPNAISPYSAVTRYWDFTHRIAFTPNNFQQLLPLTKFDKVSFREIGPIPHGLFSAVRWVGWQVARTLIKTRLLIETASLKGRVYSMDMLVHFQTED